VAAFFGTDGRCLLTMLAGRAAALARGEGLMGFGVAMARLNRALIPMPQSGAPMRGVFDEVFR
jgi:hypothetical protein